MAREMRGQAKFTDVGFWGSIIMAKLSIDSPSFWPWIVLALVNLIYGIIIDLKK